jgi:hypothetical protein
MPIYSLNTNEDLQPYIDKNAIFSLKISDTLNLEDELSESLKSAAQNGSREDKKLFSVEDHSAGKYVRNPNCWAADCDLTCASPWNSGGRNRQAGTLISPQHIIFAKHYQYGNGTRVRFVDRSNNVIERKMTAKKSHGSTDITVGLLDKPVPSSISYAKVLPSYYEELVDIKNLPTVCLDQEEKALGGNVRSDGKTSISLGLSVFHNYMNKFYESKIGGDSGNPMFLFWRRYPILLSHLWYGGGGGGPDYHYYRDDINEMMAELGGNRKLHEFNLRKIAKKTASSKQVAVTLSGR